MFLHAHMHLSNQPPLLPPPSVPSRKPAFTAAQCVLQELSHGRTATRESSEELVGCCYEPSEDGRPVPALVLLTIQSAPYYLLVLLIYSFLAERVILHF